MQKVRRNMLKIVFSVSIPFLCAGGVVSSVDGATISGDLYYQTAGTPLSPTTLDRIWIKAYLEDPDSPGACGNQYERWYTAGNFIDCSSPPCATFYMLEELPAGTYYLRTAEEWWNGASECGTALAIELDDSDILQGYDFVINPGGEISGGVHDESGTALVGEFDIFPYKVPANDPCEFEPGWPLLGSYMNLDGIGDYNLTGLPNGNYVLQVRGVSSYYVGGFYTSSGETTDCDNAEIVFINDPADRLIDKDFLLHEGGVISGTIYQESGTTPVTTQNMIVTVYSA
ncbi:MAG: hypothetical protein D3924_06615, partial [Candidatus Electrothrix sp. AR4]|nr:hypothetical protein [Candidatus Electrothrix sp. AR4]